MNEHEYNQRSVAKNGGLWEVPEEFFIDGHVDIEYLLQFLYDQDMIGSSIDDRMVFHPRFEEKLPQVYKMIKSILRDSEQASMDRMVTGGLATQSINESAELVYRLNNGVLLLNSHGMLD